jgi:hypothetical protein
MKKWSDNEIKNGIILNQKGLTYQEISNVLNRTKQSVRIKLNKLGYFNNDIIYYENIICKQCGEIFNSLKKENRIFCSHKCSATYNNKIRERTHKTDLQNEVRRSRYKKEKNKNCLYCGELVYDKYCNNICKKHHKQQEIFNQIESGVSIHIGNDTTTHKWYKKYLISKYGEKCFECGWNKRNVFSNTIPVELEHMDGNGKNNDLNNIKLLCPSCHSLTPTYKALNKGNGRFLRMERYKNGVSF